jgi:uncharacterized protein
MNASASYVHDSVRPSEKTTMGTKTLLSFLALTFGLSWVPMALFMLFATQFTAIFGEMSATNPIFLLAVYAPGISGIFLIWRHYGLQGLGSFVRRLSIATAINGTISAPFHFAPWYLVFPALVQSLLLGPLGEEFGWRGLALPLLQRRFSPFWASLILGVVWAVWHAPAFAMSGTPQSAWSFGPFFVGLIAITVIMTPLFNASRGSLLIAILYHLNIMNPIFPDAQPWDSFLLVFAAVAIVLLNRRQMFQCGAGVTEVLLPEDRSVRSV